MRRPVFSRRRWRRIMTLGIAGRAGVALRWKRPNAGRRMRALPVRYVLLLHHLERLATRKPGWKRYAPARNFMISQFGFLLLRRFRFLSNRSIPLRAPDREPLRKGASGVRELLLAGRVSECSPRGTSNRPKEALLAIFR